MGVYILWQKDVRDAGNWWPLGIYDQKEKAKDECKLQEQQGKTMFLESAELNETFTSSAYMCYVNNKFNSR